MLLLLLLPGGVVVPAAAARRSRASRAARRPPASIMLSISDARLADMDATDFRPLVFAPAPGPPCPPGPGVLYGDDSKAPDVPGRDMAGDIRRVGASEDEPGVVPGRGSER